MPYLLQARLSGHDEFVLAPATARGPLADASTVARARYASVYLPVLARGLATVLDLPAAAVATATCDDALLIVGDEQRDTATDLLTRASAQVTARTAGLLGLHFVVIPVPEGDDPRPELAAELERRTHTPAAGQDIAALFAPQPALHRDIDDDDLRRDLAEQVAEPAAIQWSPAEPGRAMIGASAEDGSPAFPLDDTLPLLAMGPPPPWVSLARQAQGRRTWAALRMRLDGPTRPLDAAPALDQALVAARMLPLFFAGELRRVLDTPEHRSAVVPLEVRWDGATLVGAWDHLLTVGRELHRLFGRLAESLTGIVPVARSLSMALATPRHPLEPLADVLRRARLDLAAARLQGPERLSLDGQAFAWRQWDNAAEIKDLLVRLLVNHRVPPEFLTELEQFHRERGAVAGTRRAVRLDRPWRFHRRLSRVLGEGGREREKLQQDVLRRLVVRSGGTARLQPLGRAALRWSALHLRQAESLFAPFEL